VIERGNARKAGRFPPKPHWAGKVKISRTGIFEAPATQ